MENEALKLIARLKISAAKRGMPVDVVRFAGDRAYARAVLSKFSDTADEDGIVLALQLMDKLALAPTSAAASPGSAQSSSPKLKQPGATPLAPAAKTESPAPPKPGTLPGEEKYVGRLR
jgi:hypothetical protein